MAEIKREDLTVFCDRCGAFVYPEIVKDTDYPSATLLVCPIERKVQGRVHHSSEFEADQFRKNL